MEVRNHLTHEAVKALNVYRSAGAIPTGLSSWCATPPPWHDGYQFLYSRTQKRNHGLASQSKVVSIQFAAGKPRYAAVAAKGGNHRAHCEHKATYCSCAWGARKVRVNCIDKTLCRFVKMVGQQVAPPISGTGLSDQPTIARSM
jgi:hypothetical protein